MMSGELDMRCSCVKCGVYMSQSDDSHLGCVCPECGNRCTACLGTDSVMSRDSIRAMRDDPIMASIVLDRFTEGEERKEWE